MSEQEIHRICKKYYIKNYIINSDGSIDVDGNVNLFNTSLIKIPLKFNRITGYFNCSLNKLTTLEGCPEKVGGSFNCYNNKLTSLEGCPNEVGASFNCSDNKLKTLEHSPIVGGHFYCDNNPLESFEGYNSSYDKIKNINKEKLIRKTKLKIIEKL